MKILNFLVALCLGCLLSVPAFSQMRDEIELTRAEIQKNRQMIVSLNMDLTDEEAAAFWPLYRSYQAAIAKLGDRWVELVTDYAEHYESLTDAKARELLDSFQDINLQRAKLRKDWTKKFRKILPDRKVARFFQIENKLDSIVNLEVAATIPLAQ